MPSIKVTGLDGARAALTKVDAFLGSKKPMMDFCQGVKERILGLTADGKDYKSRRFKPYTPDYAARKGTQRVDLRVSGLMLDSIAARTITPQHGMVYVKPTVHGGLHSTMLANIHTTGTGRQPRREFMNVSNAGLMELVNKHYNDPIKKLAGGARW